MTPLTTKYIDPNFVVDILTKEDYKEVGPIDYNINCQTDDSKQDWSSGAGVLIHNKTTLP